ncbi:DNA-binding transcriptional regulator, AcrR family [Methylobacterium sp. 190mf]|uniref:TetR/AcrR family transcriptional regulator C-terminal domain-containing protein n=1 Tax=Methylobacterium sp. 190mf TaxID=1761798 RepID=UPI00089ED382|nr:TetR/AcrR family transcriptional regulator C-terminal domain-containing protein [Methylobacterium sp. 190mf]SEG61583.1 DNA-binding transcriptional regulator, AcrR family [Methylobacterium sp. 190mf]
MMQASATAEREEPSARQQAVLDAVLGLMVEDGEQLTMDAVARRASCSKETLYKWFGDRDGLLTATVRWQASRVHAGHDSAQVLDGATLRERLQDFAVTWLEVITGPTSVALNRIAIAHAGSRKSNLGGIVLANGRFAIGERVKPVLEAGRVAGLLTFADSEAAFRTFFGLVGRDIQIRLLLGETLDLDGAEIRRDAGRAVEQFLALYGRARTDPKHQA